jgi:hypothetical protein
MATKVVNCNCKSEYQDQKYGPGRRVANTTAKGWRCTVCAKEIAPGAKPAAQQ